MIKKFSLQIKISLVILIPLLIMMTISNVVNIIYVQKISSKLSYKILEEVAKGERNQLRAIIRQDLYQITGLKYTIENMYNSGIRDRKAYENTIRNFFNALPVTVVGSMLAFEPNIIGYDANYTDVYPLTEGQQTYYISRSAGNSISERALPRQDIEADYYTEPMKKSKEYLSGIYEFDIGNNTKIEMYTWAVPIMYQNKPIGVITADIQITTLNKIMKAIKPFENSEGLLYDHYGKVLYDAGETVNLEKYIYDVYPKYKSHQVFETIAANRTIYFQIIQHITKEMPLIILFL